MTPTTISDHYYVICCQRRIRVRRDGEEFLQAVGPVSEEAGVYRTRREARAAIMERVNAPDWEHRNPHAAHYFYWAKRVDVRPRETRP